MQELPTSSCYSLQISDLNHKLDPYGLWFLPVPGPTLEAGLCSLWSLLILAPAIQAQGRVSIAASPVISGFEEDISYRLRVSEGYMPELPGSKRVNSTTSEFQGDEAHKPPCLKRTNPRTYKLQEDIHNYRVSRRTRFRTAPQKETRAVSTTSHIQSTSREVQLQWTECDAATSPAYGQGTPPKDLAKRRRKHKRENITSPGCMPFRRSLSSQYPIIGGISKDILTEVNQQFTCLARPYATRILQTRGYMPPGPCANKTDPAYLCNVNPGSRIQAFDQGSRSPTADSHRYN
ncbi:hypothetical protein Bca101_020537 [Brassica carinata]